MSLTIEYVKDKEGNRFYPVTQEKGVFDENGVRLDTKLNQKESTSHKVTSISASSTDVEYPSARAVYMAVQSGGGISTELDPTVPEFVKSITQQDITKWNNTVSNVQADWNADSGAAQILNKPTIPAAQVNSDWNANSGVAQILNKPNLSVYPKYVPCEDLAEYQAIQNPQSDTLYCIPEEEPTM